MLIYLINSILKTFISGCQPYYVACYFAQKIQEWHIVQYLSQFVFGLSQFLGGRVVGSVSLLDRWLQNVPNILSVREMLRVQPIHLLHGQKLAYLWKSWTVVGRNSQLTTTMASTTWLRMSLSRMMACTLGWHTCVCVCRQKMNNRQ